MIDFACFRWSIAAASTAVLLAASSASAQDFQRIAPREPPVHETPEFKPPPLPPESDDERVVMPELRGLVFLSSTDQLSPSVLKTTGIDSSKAALIQSLGLPDEVKQAIGQPLSIKSLSQLTRAVVQHLRELDHPLVDVIVPEQDVTEGTVQIVVVEFRIGAETAEGNEWFSSDLLTSQLRQKPGDTVDGQTMLDDLEWLNSNPFRQVDVVYRPSTEIGKTDISLRARDQFPLRVYTGLENSGPESTGHERWLAGFNYGNLFGLDQQLSYQFSSSTDLFGGGPQRFSGRGGPTFLAHAAIWQIPLPWHDRLTFAASYAEVQPDVPNLFGAVGRSSEVSATYEMPLRGAPGFTHALQAGYEFKRTNNNLEFGGAQVSRSDTNIHQGEVGYHFTALDDLGATGFSSNLYLSPGGIDGDNTDEAFRPLAGFHSGRSFAYSRYAYVTLGLDRVTKLPEDLSWGVRVRGQIASTNLLPSEQLGFGGETSVRGYDERALNTDAGILISNELRSPAISPYQLFGFGTSDDQLQILAFLDYGSGADVKRVQGEKSWTSLASIGPGLRYSFGSYFTAKLDYGWQLYRLAGDRDSGRLSFSLTAAY